MPKKLMIDEAHRLTKYERVIVVYKCGCSYYNDNWKSACESDALCPEHDKPIKAETGEWVVGLRPKNTKTKRHSLKMN